MATSAIHASENDMPASRLGSEVDFYQYTLSGRSLDNIKEEAMEIAVNTTIGSFFFEDRFILAPEMLEIYLGKRIESFIAGVKVLKIKRGVGTLSCDVQVAVNRKKLERDLTEKRFFYKPKKRPYFHISLSEKVDNVMVASAPGRDEVSLTLRELLARPTPFEISTPSSTLDVSANQEILYQALVAARRQGIEVILTGSIDATKDETSRLYYDDYTFYDAKVNMKLIRVQDGTVLREVEMMARASDPDETQAGINAIRRAAADGTKKILEGFFDEWRMISLDEADYRILVIDISEEQLSAFINRLSSIPAEFNDDASESKEVDVFLKSYVNNVGVLNVYFKGDVERIRRTIRESRYPKFNIDHFHEGSIKLSRLGG